MTRAVREGELTQAAEHDGADDHAVLAARARPALAVPPRTGWCATGRALEHLPAVAAAFTAGAGHRRAGRGDRPGRPRRSTRAAAAAAGVDLAGVDAVLADDRRHPPVTGADPGGAPLPGPARPRRPRTRPHRGAHACRSPSMPTAAVTGRFELDAVGGEKVQAALESIVQANRPAGDDRAPAPSSRPTPWCQLADNALAAGNLPFLRTVKPHVVVTIGLDDFVDPHTGPGAAAHRVRGARSPPPAPGGWPATANISRDRHRPRRTACSTSAAASGSFPPHLRRALDVRDRGCVVRRLRRPDPLVRRPSCRECALDDGPTNRGELRPALRTPPHQGPPRVPAWNDNPTADGAPAAPTAPRSCCPTLLPSLADPLSGTRGGSRHRARPLRCRACS